MDIIYFDSSTDLGQPQSSKPAIEPYAVLTKSSNALKFFYDDKKRDREGVDTEILDIDLALIKCTEPDMGVETEEERRPWARYADSIDMVVFDDSFADYHELRSTKSWFASMKKLTSIRGLNYLRTENVTDMSSMFDRCESLQELDLSSFDTGKVRNMEYMFNWCKSLQFLDVSSFDTSDVRTMQNMFFACRALQTIDLSSFDTGKVTNMNSMFGFCDSLQSLDLSGFNTGHVTDMGTMFFNCYSLHSLDLTSFNTEHVTDTGMMFYGCDSIESLDLRSFNLEYVENMKDMFGACQSLREVKGDRVIDEYFSE